MLLHNHRAELLRRGADHLDRYPDVDAYYADKALLFRNAHAGSRWVLNADDAGVRAFDTGPGVSVIEVGRDGIVYHRDFG